MGRWKGFFFAKLLIIENHRIVSEDGVPHDLTQGIGGNEVLKSNVITNEEGKVNGNG